MEDPLIHMDKILHMENLLIRRESPLNYRENTRAGMENLRMANDDPGYKAWIEGLPCCMCDKPPKSVMHHRTGAGMGLRASDREGIPLCWECHGDFHAYRGRFKGFDLTAARGWQSAMIRLHRALYVDISPPPEVPF